MLKVVGKGGVEEEDAEQREELKFENQITNSKLFEGQYLFTSLDFRIESITFD